MKIEWKRHEAVEDLHSVIAVHTTCQDRRDSGQLVDESHNLGALISNLCAHCCHREKYLGQFLTQTLQKIGDEQGLHRNKARAKPRILLTRHATPREPTVKYTARQTLLEGGSI